MSTYQQIVKLIKEGKIGYNIRDIKPDELYANIYHLLSIIKDSYGGQVWYLEDLISKRKLKVPKYEGLWNEYNNDMRDILIQNDIEIITKVFIDINKIIKNDIKNDVYKNEKIKITY